MNAAEVSRYVTLPVTMDSIKEKNNCFCIFFGTCTTDKSSYILLQDPYNWYCHDCDSKVLPKRYKCTTEITVNMVKVENPAHEKQ